MQAAGVPAGPVNTLDEAFAFAQKLGLPGIVDIPAAPVDGSHGAEGTPSRQVASPIALSGTPTQYRLPPPRLGQHTAEILRRLSDPVSAPNEAVT
jgi:crotonobetainyl-CoA:carnitine CoA-transferase CaiB-like acyl-CoA transferase